MKTVIVRPGHATITVDHTNRKNNKTVNVTTSVRGHATKHFDKAVHRDVSGDVVTDECSLRNHHSWSEFSRNEHPMLSDVGCVRLSSGSVENPKTYNFTFDIANVVPRYMVCGATTYVEYDSRRRITRIIKPNVEHIFDYVIKDSLTLIKNHTILDADGMVKSYSSIEIQYDTKGRVVREHNSYNNRTVEWRYNEHGQLAEKIMNGVRTVFSYDTKGRRIYEYNEATKVSRYHIYE